MTYTEYSSVNASEGFQEIFIYVNDVTSGLFSNMLLFSLFVITFLGSFFASKRQTGQGSMAVSFAVSGYFVFGASLLMLLIPNLVNVGSVVICFVVAIIGSLWLYFGDRGD